MQYLVLIIIAALLWLRAYISPCSNIDANDISPLYALLLNALPANTLLGSIAAFALLLAEALILNFILIRHDLLPKNSLVAALVFVVLMSIMPQAIGLGPILCAAAFIIPGFD